MLENHSKNIEENVDLFLILDLIAMPIHIIDRKGKIIFVNKAWTNVYKVPLASAINQNIETLMKDQLFYFVSIDDPAQLYDEANNLIKYSHFDHIMSKSAALHALSERKKISMITTSTDKRKLIVTSTPVFDDQNEIDYVFTFVQDLSKITDWKERLDSEIEKNRLLTKELEYYVDKNKRSELIGTSKKMMSIKDMIPMVAKTDAAVLILGESGVGKEVLAKEIYANSNRSHKPFISVNCSAIPDHLLESELFGHEKGAFTGAIKSKEGLFEVANGGTLLLDEIGSMPLNLQPKLLRVLQENEFMRVGGVKKIPIDVRILSATNENLLALVKAGKFRQDLYYRLNVVPVVVPPLRERREDIQFLCLKFLETFNKKYDKHKYINDRALYALEQYDWPGNIRELKNAVERLVIIGDKDCITYTQVQYVTASDGSEAITSDGALEMDPRDGLSLKENVAAFEKRIIEDALIRYKNTYDAARALKSSQPTIARKAKQYGITKSFE